MTGLETLEHRQVLAQRLQLAADGPRPVEHADAELGRHRAPAAANEELDAELGLELVHVPRDVRLHGVQPVGRRGERALLGHREQSLELAYVHCRSPRPARAQTHLE